MDPVLFDMSFSDPAFKNAAFGSDGSDKPPRVVSFGYATKSIGNVTVSWSTNDVDKVQLHYPCVKNLLIESSITMKCGDGAPTDYYFRPNGSMEFYLTNYTKHALPFVLTIMPFADGVEYPRQSKTITISVNPKSTSPVLLR